jgi:hypothetical protein
MKWLSCVFGVLLTVASAQAQAPADHGDLLGPVFESQAAGIAMRGPVGSRQIRRPASDDVVIYVDEARKWTMTVTRAQLSTPLKLSATKNAAGEEVPGLMESTVKQILVDKPGATILRDDVITLGDVRVGVIAAKFDLGLDAFLMQQALLRVTDNHYFVINFVSPAPKAGALEEDADTRRAVETFTAVLESVRLLDQSEIREDQAQRLFRTRTLFVSLNEPRMRNALVPVQWLRIIENGKDIGYTYVVEEIARDLPRNNVRPERQAGAEGVLVGVRSRMIRDGSQADSEAWMFCTFDRKSESWSMIGLVDDPKGGKSHLSELGVTTKRTKPVPDKGSVLEKGNKDVALTDEYLLSVTRIGQSANPQPIRQELPVFYLPQAVGHLLPRLLPRNDPKGYMFASYTSDSGQVKARYIDVGREESVTLGGQTFRAIPIGDRIGLEGSITMHYISPDGKYLGSVNKDSKITVLPTDAPTLEKLWKNVNLTRPGAVEEK